MTTTERLQIYLEQEPSIHPTAYVASDAVVIGACTIGPSASIWHGCVLRGDIERIVVGEGSNVQDGTIVHLADDLGVYIGDYVTIGHKAMIHACTIEDECLIGMSATILDGAVIGARSIVGAGAVVTKDTVVPPGSMVLGTPAKVIRSLSAKEQMSVRDWATKYVEVSAYHKAKYSEDIHY